MNEGLLTARAFANVQKELREVDTAVGLVEALVHRLVALLVQLAVDGRQGEVARRVARSFADVVVVEQHAHHAPVEACQYLNHDGAHFTVGWQLNIWGKKKQLRNGRENTSGQQLEQSKRMHEEYSSNRSSYVYTYISYNSLFLSV